MLKRVPKQQPKNKDLLYYFKTVAYILLYHYITTSPIMGLPSPVKMTLTKVSTIITCDMQEQRNEKILRI